MADERPGLGDHFPVLYVLFTRVLRNFPFSFIFIYTLNILNVNVFLTRTTFFCRKAFDPHH